MMHDVAILGCGPVGALAHDLIPPIVAAIVEPGGVERAVQPLVSTPGGGIRRLDEATGGGWVLVARETARLTPPVTAIWDRLGGITAVLGLDVDDVGGHLRAWLDRHVAAVAIVGPDLCAYAFPFGNEGDIRSDRTAGRSTSHDRPGN